MDARYTHTTKIALFLAAALFLALPLCAVTTPTTVLTPSSGTTIQLDQRSCNDLQIVNLTSTGSTGAAITVTASIQYTPGDPHGNWLFVTAPSGAQTTGGAGIPGIVVPAEHTTQGPAGINLEIGLAAFNLGATSDTATVLLHVTSTNPNDPSAADVTITVNYVFNPSAICGGTGPLTNGTETITPGSLTMAASQGSAVIQQLTVYNLTGNSIIFTAQAQSANDTWLTTDSQAPTTLPANGQATVNVTATAGASMALTAFNSGVVFTWSLGTTLTVPVQFTVSSGSNGNLGTLTLNGATSNTANVSFTYIGTGSSATGLPPAQTVPIQDSNPLITTYGASFTTSNGSSWLNVNGSFSSPQSGLQLSNNVGTLQPKKPVASLQTRT